MQAYLRILLKNLALYFEGAMYRHDAKQMTIEDFEWDGGKLCSDNRWVKLAKLIPWDEVEFLYVQSLSMSERGAPAISARVALGALIIKEMIHASDEETVNHIRENPYMQYFLGFGSYSHELPFHPTMFVHFRKRFGKKVLAKINEIISTKALEADSGHKPSPDDNPPESSELETHKGKLIIDATCVPADITYPTDLKIINEAREKTEQIIDVLHEPLKGKQKKPRTYRKKARKEYLAATKSKRIPDRKKRRAIRKQLCYLNRNLKAISKLSEQVPLSVLSRRQYKELLVINEVYRQQKWMFDNRTQRISDRIVSISQPHVRPIKRNKAGASTEFGAKISVSLVDGYAFVDHISWDNYNESCDLIEQVKTYRRRFGFWPKSVHVDQIYRTRENRKFCKKYGIRLSGPPLGRPSKNVAVTREAKKQIFQDEIDRNAIEGKFGQGKRRFGLGRVMCKLAVTSEVAIMVTFLVMNLKRWLATIIFWLLKFGNLFVRLGSVKPLLIAYNRA